MSQILDFLLHPSILWLSFLLLAGGVAMLAIILSKCVAALSEKTNLGGAFLGGFVLSLVTSLPELMASITSSMIGNPTLSYNNIFGANTLTVTVIAILDIIFIKKFLFSKISNQNKQIITIVAIINIMVLVSLLMGNGLQLIIGNLKISGLFFAVFVFYVYFVYVMYKNVECDDDCSSSGFEKLSLKQVLILFFAVSITLIAFASMLTYVTDVMGSPSGYNLGNEVAGALLLSICTALPETVSALSLARMGHGNIAIGGIVGSHLFNITILFYGDLVYYQQGTFKRLIDNVVEARGFLNLIIINTVVTLLLLVSTYKKNITNKLIYILPSCVIVVIYLVGWFSGFISG